MEAVHFVQDLATGVKLALVSAHTLDRRERGHDLLAAERVVARKRPGAASGACRTQPPAPGASALVAVDPGQLDLRMAGEGRDHFLGLEAVVARDRFSDGVGGHLRGSNGGTPPARLKGAG